MIVCGARRLSRRHRDERSTRLYDACLGLVERGGVPLMNGQMLIKR
jgi:hypothetical protein